MDKVKETEQGFVCRNALVPDLASEMAFLRNIILKALFELYMKWRLVEEFGQDCYEIIEDGRLLLIQDYSDMNDLTMCILTFEIKLRLLN